ncbi:hypothetical protein BKA70DRAFT_1113743 [Coprinopsis sp. MPI-PUGE-AT-0042]|nr:hypothetical protein BKA70DRAFT_1113743 [Coprinopsis sp. MPI-PUGE-AT-0042]
MIWILFFALTPVAALLRFPCSQLRTERLDPLVTPGRVSPHVHQIVGGVSLNPSRIACLNNSTGF